MWCYYIMPAPSWYDVQKDKKKLWKYNNKKVRTKSLLMCLRPCICVNTDPKVNNNIIWTINFFLHSETNLIPNSSVANFKILTKQIDLGSLFIRTKWINTQNQFSLRYLGLETKYLLLSLIWIQIFYFSCLSMIFWLGFMKFQQSNSKLILKQFLIDHHILHIFFSWFDASTTKFVQSQKILELVDFKNRYRRRRKKIPSISLKSHPKKVCLVESPLEKKIIYKLEI